MEKSKLSIVMVGHVDHGKSTLIGRLLYDTHSISEDKIAELEKASLATDNKLEFAFLLDHLREEREQGITIDTTQTFFKTKNREYQIIDAPGHVEFVRNMVTGAAQASSAVLIIDATEGVMQQTRRHSFILSLLGIKQLIVVVNKMDKIDYSKDRFNMIVNDTQDIFKQLRMETTHFIPISALDGDNVCIPSRNMDWYQGKTLIDVMEELEAASEREDLPCIFPVQDIYKVGDKRVTVGRLEAGILHKDDEVKVLQTGQITKVSSIEKFLEKPVYAKVGECIGITTEDAVFLERGNVVCQEGAKVQLVSEIEASIIWMERKPVHVGEKLIIRCDTQETICVIDTIKHKLNTGQLVEDQKDVNQLEDLDAGKVVIKLKKQLAVSKFTDYESIGRFVILRDDNICAGGIIL